MNYVYYGEAYVAQANLESFLALAQELELKGLTSRDEVNSQQRSFRQPPAQQVNLRPSSSQVVQEPPLSVNNNHGAGGGGGAVQGDGSMSSISSHGAANNDGTGGGGEAFGGEGGAAAPRLNKEELEYDEE